MYQRFGLKPDVPLVPPNGEPQSLLLQERIAQLYGPEDEIALGPIVEGSQGQLGLPAVVRRASGQLDVLYTHHGAWTQYCIDSLLAWVVRLRAWEPGERAHVRIVSDEPVPVAAHDVVDSTPAALTAVLSLGIVDSQDPVIASATLTRLLRYLLGTELQVDAHSVRVLDELVASTLHPTRPESRLLEPLAELIGGYLAQVLSTQLGRNPDWWDDNEPDPFQHARDVLRAPPGERRLSEFCEQHGLITEGVGPELRDSALGAAPSELN